MKNNTCSSKITEPLTTWSSWELHCWCVKETAYEGTWKVSDVFTCYDGDCLIRPINTCDFWNVIRSDYMIGHTGNRVFWADSEHPTGPKTIQIPGEASCEQG